MKTPEELISVEHRSLAFTEGLDSKAKTGTRRTAADLTRLADRFWSKVNRNGPYPRHAPGIGHCWTWLGVINEWGYAKFRIGAKQVSASRIALELERGPIDWTGVEACHRCDNRACVRPSHIFVGTHTDNMQDMIAKGRHRNCPLPGEKNGRARLTRAQVREVVKLFASGWWTKRELSKRFGVHEVTIHHILVGNNWSSITGIKRAVCGQELGSERAKQRETPSTGGNGDG